ncbi:MAG TPA: hypothetical protein VEZ55_01915, partial [Chitinophagaceae bacterium]|nr:hypothetical protein [Chitinophagaceae bacterium]
MRSFFPFTTACLLLFTTITLRAQSDDFAYAITDYSKEGTSWNVLRKIDLNTGKYSSVLLDGANVRALTLQPKSKSLKSAPAPATLPETAFNTGVAALALDKANNRLYFSPMFVSQLRYIDLSSMKVYA